MKFKSILYLLFPSICWAFSFWTPTVDKSIKFLWSTKHISISTPKADINCDVNWINDSHLECYNVRATKVKTLLPNPKHVAMFLQIQKNNVTVEITEKCDDYLKIKWKSGDYTGEVELKK